VGQNFNFESLIIACVHAQAALESSRYVDVELEELEALNPADFDLQTPPQLLESWMKIAGRLTLLMGIRQPCTRYVPA
jgi:hypothetical protein